VVASHHVPDMSAQNGVANGPSNGALDIQQLWASGGRTREPNLMEFGKQHHETWMTVPLWYKINIKSGRKTANINTKNLRSFITVKAHCS